VATTGAIRRAKLQSKCHHQQTNTSFLQAQCPSCHPTNSVKALKEVTKHTSTDSLNNGVNDVKYSTDDDDGRSLRFNGHFPGEPGLPVFIEAKDDGGAGDNWTTGAISRAKLQSNHHRRQTNTSFLQAGCPSCHQPTVSKH